MAIQRTVTIPGGSRYTASYFSINRVALIDARRKEAKFFFDLYADATHAATPGAVPVWPEAVHVTFRGAAFDAYFSKSAAVAAAQNAYAALYQAMNDATAAFKAKAAKTDLTPAQKVLTQPGNVDIASDFGNAAVFADSTPA